MPEAGADGEERARAPGSRRNEVSRGWPCTREPGSGEGRARPWVGSQCADGKQEWVRATKQGTSETEPGDEPRREEPQAGTFDFAQDDERIRRQYHAAQRV